MAKEGELEKVIEKYYIEVTHSKKTKFIHGLYSGFGYAVGITLGTVAVFVILGLVLSKIDFVPIFGTFLSDIIKSAQGNLSGK